MSNIPADLQYTQSHEWVRRMPNGQIEVGITDHAQEALGDLVFVEVPQAQRRLKAGEACAVVESVKAASDVYAPATGTVLEVNQALESNPEKVNLSPYADGWMLKLKLASPAGAALLSAEDYAKVIA